MFDVISFGSATIDTFVETGLPEKGKFMAYPVGAKMMAKGLRFDIGGGGTNTAVAFSRFGLKTGYIGKLDSGMEGNEVLNLLKKEGITFLGTVEKDKKKIGGYSVILDSKEDDRTILSFKGVNEEIKMSDIKKSKTKWLYMSSFLGKSFDTQKKFAHELHKKGAKIAYNPSDYLIRAKKKEIKEILKFTEVLVLNYDEAKLLTKEKDVLKGLKKLGPKIIVVTNKDKPTSAYDGEKKYSILPHKIKVAERTGAGDAFASGFVAGQIVGKSIDESLKLALEESESVIRYFGAKNKLLKRKLK